MTCMVGHVLLNISMQLPHVPLSHVQVVASRIRRAEDDQGRADFMRRLTSSLDLFRGLIDDRRNLDR